MVKSRMDKYGRILIPKEARSRLNIDEGDVVEIVVKDQGLLLRRTDADLNERVQAWTEAILQSAPKAFMTEIRVGDSKWLSKGYCLRKLGL